MGYTDYVVKYDPNVDTPQDLTRKILYSIFILRVKYKKPAVIFVSGDSGEGKSISSVRLLQELMELQGLDYKKHMDGVNIYTPIQYPEKLNKILYDKEYKKANILIIHEARTLIKAKMWNSFLTQAIADVNAMSRQIKPMITIIISQFIRDITTDMRYTLNFYVKIKRLRGDSFARMQINVMWKDDRDLEKPKLRKRRLRGFLVYPNGKYRRHSPQYLAIKKPDKEICQEFDRQDAAAKTAIIHQRLEKLVKEMRDDLGLESKKISSMVDWYTEHIENLSLIGKRYKAGWKILKEARQMHDMTSEEVKSFELALNKKLKEMEVIVENEG
jgi:hypothetical protein